MTDKLPKATKAWPPENSSGGYSFKVGKKCRCNTMKDSDGYWLEVGGVLSTGGVGVDPSQARLYYNPGNEKQAPAVRVILPDDMPFRISRKGLRLDKTKSFDNEGNPVPQVRLLYALKTGTSDDRARATEAFPANAWGNENKNHFDATVFNEINYYTQSNKNLLNFAARLIAKSILEDDGLKNWALWDKVANEAASYSQRMKKINAGESPPDNHALFVQAVKEVAINFLGLPAQCDVKELWEKRNGRGAWREIQKTLGFQWLPSKYDSVKIQSSVDFRRLYDDGAFESFFC